jgi:hypothetical protein
MDEFKEVWGKKKWRELFVSKREIFLGNTFQWTSLGVSFIFWGGYAESF